MRLKILISGAGIAGRTAATHLRKQGHQIRVVERATKPRITGAGIALPANAIEALAHMNLAGKVLQRAHRVHRIKYHKPNGQLLASAPLTLPPLNRAPFVAMKRADLQEVLAEESEDSVEYNCWIKQIIDNTVKLSNNTIQDYHLIIAADGVHSNVRQLVSPNSRSVDLGATTYRWLQNIETSDIDPSYFFGFGAFLAYPISRNQVYCYTHLPDPEQKYLNQNPHAVIEKHFKHYGGIAGKLLSQLEDSIELIPGRLSSVATINLVKNNVVMIGDAASACSPMLQQGAASAFEDVLALGEMLQQFPDLDDALSQYQAFRQERLNWTLSSSDTPMRAILNLTDEKMLAGLYQRIERDGPLNVLGWRHLLAKPYPDLLHDFCQSRTKPGLTR